MKIFVKTKPNSREESVEKIDDSNYVVRVKEKPVGGAANEGVVRVLAEYFGVSKSRVKILMGKTAREKWVEIL